MKLKNSLISYSIFLFLFFSCKTGDIISNVGSVNFDEEKIVNATETEIWNYSSSNPIFRVNPETLSVKINGNIEGKNVYLVKVNTGKKIRSYNEQRKIENSSSSLKSSLISISQLKKELPNILSEFSNSKHYFVDKNPLSLKGISRSFSAVNSRLSVKNITNVTQKSVGSEKLIYVDSDLELKSFTQKKATLKYCGSYCYVWVIDGYFGSENNQVNDSIVKNIANKFDEMYPIITNVFGNESDKIIDYNNQQIVSMNSCSDTGTKINIVLYDIANDYNDSSISTTGLAGYFASKDYYSSGASNSNKGKYFYVDSGYAKKNINETFLTLAHEFQHMIQFGKKTIEKNLTADTSYNEMLSMLCEDFMQSKLGISDSTSPKNRFHAFNSSYYQSGVREYLTVNPVISYADSYAFGAWLCRQYGGVSLLKEIMSNSFVNNESLVSAVNLLNGTNFSFEDLFEQFILSLLGDSHFSLNNTVSKSIGDYNYIMSAIDINAYPINKSAFSNYIYKNYNKGILVVNNSVSLSLRPYYGMIISGICELPSGTSNVDFSFSASGLSSYMMYLVIK